MVKTGIWAKAHVATLTARHTLNFQYSKNDLIRSRQLQIVKTWQNPRHRKDPGWLNMIWEYLVNFSYYWKSKSSQKIWKYLWQFSVLLKIRKSKEIWSAGSAKETQNKKKFFSPLFWSTSILVYLYFGLPLFGLVGLSGQQPPTTLTS